MFALFCFAIGFGILAYKRPLWILNAAMRVRLLLAGIRSEYVMVGSYRVHYLVGGHGTPLLLIHGLASRSEDWASQIAVYVKNGFRVYAVDLLGCGRTDRPDIAYTIPQQAALIHAFMAALHLEQADIIGWSMGGWVAMELALRHPDCTRRLVLMNSAGLWFETSLTPDIFEPSTIREMERLERLLTPSPRRVPAFFQRDLLRILRRNRPVVHRMLESMIADENPLRDRLGQLAMPVLIVWGEQDALIPQSVGMQLHDLISQSVLQLYGGCGHLAPATCAHRIIPNVLKFLRCQPPMAPGTYHYR